MRGILACELRPTRDTLNRVTAMQFEEILMEARPRLLRTRIVVSMLAVLMAMLIPSTPLPAQESLNPTEEQKSPASQGVDAALVGTWELKVPNPLGISRWVWEIHQDGTYDFHAEGPGAAPAHSGTFAASQGHYTLNSTTLSWNDVGTYRLATKSSLIATGRLGTGIWQRVAPKVAADSAPKVTGDSASEHFATDKLPESIYGAQDPPAPK
jgi:hypothetical protein